MTHRALLVPGLIWPVLIWPVLIWIFLPGEPVQGQSAPPANPRERDAAVYVPDVAALTAVPPSPLSELVDRYRADRANLLRFHDVSQSRVGRERLRSFYQAWSHRLKEVPFDTLPLEGRIDWVLLRDRLQHELDLHDRDADKQEEMSVLLPFADAIVSLQDARRRLDPVDARAAAETLAKVADEIERVQRGIAGTPDDTQRRRSATNGGRGAADAASTASRPGGAAAPASKPTRIVALRAANAVRELKRALDDWFKHYDGYDPMMSWWVREPYGRVAKALDAYVDVLREKVVGVRKGEDEPIVGDPIGRAALLRDLAFELIPYTPEELIRLANRELAWCEAEMRRAARDMGLGDDWKEALERVKARHVEPGQQPTLIRDLAQEAIDFLAQHDLVTVPPLAADGWRMTMLSPEAQKVNPFFLGGEVIQVSFPTDSMAHDDKIMSLRANNVHFSRATVHHELVPGHHLQGFMTERYNAHRRVFATPFWTEGWALYWEMLLWDLGFAKTPEDRVGFLFWRMHRCARIIFSLGFHLGTMTPDECIDLLVNRVGHERNSAEGEVRRSFNGDYPPLYQAAYMLGGLQFRALHRQLVGSGRMTNRQFHDRILQGGRMPVEMVRARLLDEPPAANHRPSWRWE
jgi:Bacterial protein of unknown function (DUF885)